MVHKRYTSGFTLIELMIALTLGLLIVAAGLAVFLSSQRSLNLQSGMGELQQNANFGLSLITHDLRHTNLNTVSSQRVNSYTTGSGIIFKEDNLPVALRTISNLEAEFVTLQGKDDDNTTSQSDRLTIQYTPETETVINCEGGVVGTAADPASSKVIVQRYYLAEAPQQITGEPTSYSLYCDAGSYAGSDTTITGLNTNAQQIMQRVDAFRVRLGVKNPNGEFRYMTINEYTDAMTVIRTACTTPIVEDICAKDYLQVVSMDVGILSRSTGTIGADSSLNTQTTFKLAGADVSLPTDATSVALNKKYLRQAVNQVVAIRNTLGAS
ncbi:PilW family protein [Acinetobacter haemolyticus]|uniref:PilW family protein n=1 Tax=Acinetobacter haemolyticus TaxID=29430 RepID=UPI0002CFB288|nr:PilW family protein [Acinetobacter haemolyticus]ENW22480.1 hypothetical protein F926_00499 [Acinetobacter haemolyticus NIPH 261]